MKIDAAREGGAAVLRLGGRLDREGAEHLSNTLEDLLRDGVRSLTIDLGNIYLQRRFEIVSEPA